MQSFSKLEIFNNFNILKNDFKVSEEFRIFINSKFLDPNLNSTVGNKVRLNETML